MAKFLNTSGTSHHLEQLIESASERLILISPYLKFGNRIKEHLKDKNTLKLDVRIIYGKTELQPTEIQWLSELRSLKISFVENLHAKCYMNENTCIITSMNLYDFSQINNEEMGILIQRSEDSELYHDAYKNVQRLIRMAEDVELSMKQVSHDSETYEKLSTSKIAKQIGITTRELNDKLIKAGHLAESAGKLELTDKGKKIGGESKKNQFGPYFVWPQKLAEKNRPKG